MLSIEEAIWDRDTEYQESRKGRDITDLGLH